MSGTGDFQFDFDNAGNATAALTTADSERRHAGRTPYLGGAMEPVGQLATDHGHCTVFGTSARGHLLSRTDGIELGGKRSSSTAVFMPPRPSGSSSPGTSLKEKRSNSRREPGLNGAEICERIIAEVNDASVADAFGAARILRR